VEQQLWEEMEEDNYILTKAADVLHSLLKTQGANYLPFMDNMVVPLVTKLIGQDRHWQERQWGLCIWDDIMEFTGAAAVKYQQAFVPNMLNYLSDTSAEVRQASSYGCGIMAQYGQDAFAQACKEALPGLARIVSDPESRGENNITATENAISAVAKIIKYCPSCVNIDEVIPLWLSWLPIWEDKDEMDSVYGLLCDLLESNSVAVLGPQGSNLPRIVQIVAETFLRRSLGDDSTVKPRLINLIRMIQNDANLFQMCFAALSAEQQQALQDTLQQQAA